MSHQARHELDTPGSLSAPDDGVRSVAQPPDDRRALPKLPELKWAKVLLALGVLVSACAAPAPRPQQPQPDSAVYYPANFKANTCVYMSADLRSRVLLPWVVTNQAVGTLPITASREISDGADRGVLITAATSYPASDHYCQLEVNTVLATDGSGDMVASITCQERQCGFETYGTWRFGGAS
jgi:hypothetical protein